MKCINKPLRYHSQGYTSRSEQAPGTGFQHSDESDKTNCGFMGHSWFNKNVDPERYNTWGSYKPLVNNIAHQIKEILLI